MLGVDGEVFQRAVAAGGQQLLVVRVGLRLRELRGRHESGQERVLAFTGALHDRLGGHRGVLSHLEHDLVGARGAHRIGLLVPVGVAHEDGLLAGLVRLDLVRAGGHRQLAVAGRRALAVGHGGERGERDDPRPVAERRVEVEDDGLVVRRLDGAELLAVERAVVVLRTLEQRLVVAQAAGQRVGEGTLQPVLDVLGGDGRAVGELEPVLERVRPRLAVVARLAGVGGQIGHDLRLALVGDLPRGQAAEDVAVRGGRQTLALGRVQIHLRAGQQHVQRAALDGGAARRAGGGVVVGRAAAGQRQYRGTSPRREYAPCVVLHDGFPLYRCRSVEQTGKYRVLRPQPHYFVPSATLGSSRL